MNWVGIKNAVSRLKNSARLNANVFADMETGRVFASDAEWYMDAPSIRRIWTYSGLYRNVPTMAELRAKADEARTEWETAEEWS